MALLLITYNVRADDTDYDDLFETIESLGVTWHRGDKLDSVWFLSTRLTVQQVNSALMGTLSQSDSWLVVDITGMQRQGWLPRPGWTWLREHDA